MASVSRMSFQGSVTEVGSSLVVSINSAVFSLQIGRNAHGERAGLAWRAC